MSSPGILAEVCYFAPVNGVNRLLYTEKAAHALTEMTRAPYRLAVANGEWPAAGRAPASMHLEMIRLLAGMDRAAELGEDARSSSIPALSQEEHEVARLLLSVFDYCAGRGIDLGKATMLAHMHKAGLPRKK